MCCDSTGSFIRLVVWYRIPLRGLPPQECDADGGHVTLQVKHGNEFVHLGWWPIYWELQRQEKPASNRSIAHLKRIRKKLWEWCFPHRGKKTRYSRKSEVPRQADPADIDSILVLSPRLEGKPKVADIAEALPSAEYFLCVPDVPSVLAAAKQFNASRHIYHVVFNNCASVIARTLQKGGVSFPWYAAMSPRSLEAFCKANLLCSTPRG